MIKNKLLKEYTNLEEAIKHHNQTLEFGKNFNAVYGFCQCGLPDYQCKKTHKKKNAKRKDFSGKSNTPYGQYEER